MHKTRIRNNPIAVRVIEIESFSQKTRIVIDKPPPVNGKEIIIRFYCMTMIPIITMMKLKYFFTIIGSYAQSARCKMILND